MTWLWAGLTAVVFFLWTVLAYPTPAEQARLMDSFGNSTGRVWARPLPATAPPSSPPSPMTIKVPSQADLLSGKACLPMSFLLSNRPIPAGGDFGYSKPVDCPARGKEPVR